MWRTLTSSVKKHTFNDGFINVNEGTVMRSGSITVACRLAFTNVLSVRAVI